MIHFTSKPFYNLTLDELYAIMAIRQEVFVVEQNCPYLDVDGKDQMGVHLMGWNTKEELIAYTRLLNKGISYPDYPSIGRVVTSPSVRGTGIGKLLMEESIKVIRQLFPENKAIKISAQCYLTRFYESFGFQSTGKEYLEDDIPHIAMLLSNDIAFK